MKLLYITNAINGSGGLERVLATKASYFAEVLKYDVSILVLNGGSERPFFSFSRKIQLIDIKVAGHPLAYWKAYRKGIQQTVAHLVPDIIMVCDDGLKAFFIPSILKSFSIPVVYERHVSKLIELPPNAGTKARWMAKMKWAVMDRLAQKFDAFVVLTAGNVNEWKHLNNLEVIANPIPYLPEVTTDWTQKRIICVGKVSFQKGQDVMAEMWGQLCEKYPDWELYNFGKLEEGFLSSSQLPERMYLRPPTPNIMDEYLKSSIYVLPSRYEGFGMVLIEAMSFGIPCIAFDCNYGPSDIIRHGVDGYLVHSDNKQEFVDSLKHLMMQTNKRMEMGEQAKQSVGKYHIASIATKWKQLWGNLEQRKK